MEYLKFSQLTGDTATTTPLPIPPLSDLALWVELFNGKNLGNLRVDIMATPPHETLNGCEPPSCVGKASYSTLPANFKSLLDLE